MERKKFAGQILRGDEAAEEEGESGEERERRGRDGNRCAEVS